MFRKIPRPLWFALAGLIQVGLVAAMVVDRMSILREGTEVSLQTRPVDPRDFLRGDYVTLGYDISTIPDEMLPTEPTGGFARGQTLYVRLSGDGSKDNVRILAVAAQPMPLQPGEVMIRGQVAGGVYCDGSRRYCGRLWLNYGLERYFVPEGEGLAIEQARNAKQVKIVAAVTANGRAAIKRLLLDGKAVYDEPSF